MGGGKKKKQILSGAEALILYELNKREPDALGISIFSIPVEEGTVSPSLLDRALRKMVRRGLVEFNKFSRRYQLTWMGKIACEEWIRDFTRAKHRIPP